MEEEKGIEWWKKRKEEGGNEGEGSEKESEGKNVKGRVGREIRMEGEKGKQKGQEEGG